MPHGRPVVRIHVAYREGETWRRSCAYGLAAGVISRSRSPAPTSEATNGPKVELPADIAGVPLMALKDEIFILEKEKMNGSISETEYEEVKKAFDVLLRRILQRNTELTNMPGRTLSPDTP